MSDEETTPLCQSREGDEHDHYGSHEDHVITSQPFLRSHSFPMEDGGSCNNSFEMVQGDSEDCQAYHSHMDTHSHHHSTARGTIITLESGAIPTRVNVRGDWMERPLADPTCPPGLEHLEKSDSIVVRGHPHEHKLISGWRFTNRYGVYNKNNEIMTYGIEEVPGGCGRLCPGPDREFSVVFFDQNNYEVLRISRAGQCCHWFCVCCCCLGCQRTFSNTVTIIGPRGQRMGFIQQENAMCTTRLSLRNPDGEKRCLVTAPILLGTEFIPDKVQFPVVGVNEDDSYMGRIAYFHSKIGDGFGIQLPYFRIRFPAELDVRMKTVYLAASLVLDYIHFEAYRRGYNRRYNVLKKM